MLVLSIKLPAVSSKLLKNLLAGCSQKGLCAFGMSPLWKVCGLPASSNGSSHAGKMLGGGSDHASEMKEAFASCVACLIDFFSLNVCFTKPSYITELSIEFYTRRHKAFL